MSSKVNLSAVAVALRALPITVVLLAVLAGCRCPGPGEQEYRLSLSVSSSSTGTGSVMADPAGPYYAAGTAVHVSALADAGSFLWGWKNASSGKYDSITLPDPVIMDANKDLRVTFAVPEIAGNGLDDDLDESVDEP